MPKDRQLKEALETERNRRGLNKRQMAELLGVTPQVYSNWLNRVVPRDYETRSQIARKLEWDLQAVGIENSVISKMRKPAQSQNRNVAPGPDLKGEVPLISWVQARAWHEAENPHPPGNAEDHKRCPSSHGPRTYALRVEGDSMTSSNGPSFPSGIIIFVDPDQAVENEDLAIARVEGELTFKRYVRDGGRQYLESINPRYDIIREPFQVLGKVIGAFIET